MKKTDLFRRSVATTNAKNGYLASMDALEFMSTLRDSVADVVFLDPPFNLGKQYGSLAALEQYDPDSYDVYMRAVIKQGVRVLRRGGALFVYQMPYWAMKWAAFLDGRLEFRSWIAVSMKNGFARGRHLYPAHYSLLYYTKGSPSRFTRPRLALWRCRHCQGIVKDYGGYRRIVERKGVNLSDVWDDLSPVRHRSVKLRTPNQLPQEITDRVCKIAGGSGALLVDPFVGTGTSLVSASERGMHFVANDIVKSNITISAKRLGQVARTGGRK